MRVAAAIIVIAVVGACALLIMRGKRLPQFKTIDEFVQYLAAEAVADADRENHVHLDYSIQSIQAVERILGQLHDQYAANSSSISANGLAAAYGAYIGETIRRNEPHAKWEKSDAVGGEKSYPLVWGAGRSYPMAWCYHRIINGPEDNVWVKYSVLKGGPAAKGSATSPEVGRK